MNGYLQRNWERIVQKRTGKWLASMAQKVPCMFSLLGRLGKRGGRRADRQQVGERNVDGGTMSGWRAGGR